VQHMSTDWKGIGTSDFHRLRHMLTNK
jgi:hypothetical protein